MNDEKKAGRDEKKAGPLWVFGYGSLMWRPDFPYRERRSARMSGVHRALCVYSWVHRGTQINPGLVLGLDRGGSCRGVGFCVAEQDRETVVDTLRAREQVTGVYLERTRTMMLEDGRAVAALVYLVDRAHAQYAGRLDEREQLTLIGGAQGRSGANPEYVIRTNAHLKEMGIVDGPLDRLSAHLQSHRKPA